MDHLSDERLIAHLDGELSESDRRRAERHLEACGECAAALEELRLASRHLTEALARIDRPAPARDPGRVRGLHRSRKSWVSRRSLAAAAVLLILATGAAAAIPGSPVREWLARTLRTEAPAVEEPAGQEDAPPVAAATDREAGVAVEAADGDITVRVLDAATGTLIRVRLVDGDRAGVRAERARYRTSAGRIDVLGAGPGEVRVELPRGVGSARLEAEGRPLLVVRGREVRILAPAADSAGSEILFRIGG